MTDNTIRLATLRCDLLHAGIKHGYLLTVHSSLRSIGQVEGGAKTVVDAIVETVQPGGAVLFPSNTFNGSLTKFLRRTPEIDLREHPSCNGAIPRAAGARPDAIRSVHPTHPVIGIGDRAAEFLNGQQSGEGPCGIESPFYKIAMAGGQILMIGVTNDTNTTLHCVEELAGDYTFCGEVFDTITTDMFGKKYPVTVKGYVTDTPRLLSSIEGRLLDNGIMRIASLGQAEMRIVDGKRLVENCTQWLRDDQTLFFGKK